MHRTVLYCRRRVRKHRHEIILDDNTQAATCLPSFVHASSASRPFLFHLPKHRSIIPTNPTDNADLCWSFLKQQYGTDTTPPTHNAWCSFPSYWIVGTSTSKNPMEGTVRYGASGLVVWKKGMDRICGPRESQRRPDIGIGFLYRSLQEPIETTDSMQTTSDFSFFFLLEDRDHHK
mmetsp:Transcript_10609/g.21360  ORF Transcript_10609/g.21360 Transcript_10609/m.21360 type:complete len:176 (-) Transcript_10609:48-575(-)